MSKHLYPHVFGSGPTITSPLSLRHYAKRMVLPCGFTTVGDMSWTPAMQVESTDPLLWMRFWEEDYSVSTGGGRLFTASDKTSATLASFAAVNLSTTDFSLVANIYRTTTGNQVIAAKYQDATNYWRFEITAGHKLHFIAVVSGSTLIEVTGTTNVSTTATWYHCAVVVDRDAAGTTEVYLNGVNDTAGTPTVSESSIDNTGALFLAQAGDGTLYLNARLSRVGVFKADLLTQTEITWLYNLGRSRIHGSLGEVETDGANLAPTWWANCNESSDTASIVDQAAANTLALAFGELITNGGFETAGAGGADVFGSWTEVTVGTGAIADEAVIVDAGSHAAKMTAVDASNYCDLIQGVLTSGHRYTATCRARNSGSGQGKMFIGLYGTQLTIGSTASFATYSITDTATSVNLYLELYNVNCSIYIDSVSVTALDIPACDGPSSDIAPDTGSAGTAHGQLVGYDDSETARSTDVSSAIGSGTSLVLDGVDDYVACGSIGAVTAISLYVKLLIDNQEILTLANSTATAVTVAAGVLTFGASLTASAITVDGVSVSAADAGATLNDNAWHLLAFSLTSISATDCRLGTDGSNFGQIMLDQVSVNAGTNIWTFDEPTSLSVTDGDPIAIAQSLEGSRYQFLNATASKRPEYVASAINSKPGLEFDNVDDLLEYVGVPLTGTAGTVIAVCKVKAVPDAYQTLLASSDTATATKYMALHIRGNTANNHIGYGQNNAGTEDLLDGDTAVTDELDCAVYWASNGTTVTARINGTAQTLNADTGANNGDWWDDATGKDTTTIGALKHTSETNHAAIILCELIAYPINLSDASRATVAAYILREYGLTL